MSTARLVELTDTVVALDAQLSNGRTSAVALVAVREADTTNSWLDFGDNTFKTAGWATRQAVMTEISAANVPGLYRTVIDITALLPARVASDRLVVEFDVSASGPNLQVHGIDLIAIADSVYDVAEAGDAMDLVTDAVDAAAVATSGANEIRDSILSDSTSFAGANIDAAITSRSSHSAADVDTTLSGTHGAGSWETATGFAVPGDAMALTAAAIDAIWDELQAGHVTPGSFGLFLDAAITSRAIAGDSMALTAAAVDAIWDELLAGHTISGSTGEALTLAGAGGSPSAIADAVWDEARAGHLSAGTFGEAVDALFDGNIADDLAATAGSTSTEVRTGATQADGFYDEMILLVENSAGVAVRRITGYLNVNGAFTLDPALPFTPSVSDRAIVLGRLASAAIDTASIADAVWDELSAGHVGAGSFGLLLGALTAARAANLDNLDATVSSRATQVSLDSLNDISVADLLAAVIDGTVDLEEVLLRVNAFVRGRINKDDAPVSAVDIEYFEEDGTTIAFENRKTVGARTPQP